jgi:hypothetical protein
MLCRKFRQASRARAAFESAAVIRTIERSLEGEHGGTSVDAGRMSTSTRASFDFVVSRPKRSSRKFSAGSFLGTAAVAGMVLGCAWTVYANVFRADVFPRLDSANFDVPVIKRPAAVAQIAPPAADRVAAAFSELAPLSAAPTKAPPDSLSFGDRFAAAAPQGVEPKPQVETPQVAEAPKPKAEAPKLAEALKPKEAAPVQVAALPASPQPPAGPRKSAGASVRDMAQRAKAAVMSIASSEKQTIFEKLWGKQPASHGSLLAFASADASVTGSIGAMPGQPQNPALGGSAPYDRSTAVYDISAHTVYLPDGTRLEAHSGLGSELDDPRSARIRMRGVTPPHIYELKPREALFHGVPALRLNPIGGEDAIFGRSGLLAHTYMLGPNGDSNGCVSFKDYNAFLDAYRNRGIKRLAVVARVE